jgi:hypothetical protein
MLKSEDIEIRTYTGPGGDSMMVLHKPTGITRSVGSPLLRPGKAQHEMLREIEDELIKKGLTQHILPEKRPKPLNEAERLIRQSIPEVGALINQAFADVGNSPVTGSSLDQLGLANGVSVIDDYLRHGEIGLALDHLIYMVFEAKLPISAGTFYCIERAATVMGVHSDSIAKIKPSD